VPYHVHPGHAAVYWNVTATPFGGYGCAELRAAALRGNAALPLGSGKNDIAPEGDSHTFVEILF
jgi:hypothetical protein